MKKELEAFDQVSFNLREVIKQLRGLGYLLKMQMEDDGFPENIDDIREGVGLLVDTLARKIEILADRMDKVIYKKID